MAHRVNPHDFKLLDLLLIGRPEELDPHERPRRYSGDVAVWESDRELVCRLAKSFLDRTDLEPSEKDRIRRVWVEREPYVPEPSIPLSRRPEPPKRPVGEAADAR